MSGYEASEIALKWATRLGGEFHTEIYGGDYEPPLSPDEAGGQHVDQPANELVHVERHRLVGG
jgi:hypothetical protein